MFIGVPDDEPHVRAAHLDFVPYCEKEHPVGSIAKAWGGVAKLHGEDVIRYSLRELSPGLLKTALRHLPEKLAATGVEALVIDTVHFFLELVPIRLGMPYAHIWNALHLDLSGATPCSLFCWPHQTTPEALARNREGLKKVGGFLAPILAVAKVYAEQNGLEIDWNDPAATVSKSAVITQTPKAFDFPGIPWPAQFHYTGPFHDDRGRPQISFPCEKLTGEPLIYASMGTLVNGPESVYRSILEAAVRLPVKEVCATLRHPDVPFRPIPASHWCGG